MLKIKGFILTFSLLVVLVSSETVDNRTTPVNGRLSTPRPLAQEGSPIRLDLTPAASSSTVSRPVTPTRVSSPERLDQTPTRSTSSVASRPPTPVNRPQTPNPLDLSSTSNRPPTPSQSSSLKPTPTNSGSTTTSTLRPTPTPGNINETATSRSTRSTPKSTRSTPSVGVSLTTSTPLTSSTSGIKSTTSFFPIPNSTVTTSFPPSSTSELISTTSFPTSSSTSPIITSSSALSSSTESTTVSSSGSTLTSSTPSVSPSSSSPQSSTTTPPSSSSSSTSSSSTSSSSTSSSSTSPTSSSPSSSSTSTISPTPTASGTTPTSSSQSSSTPTTTSTASTSTSSPTPITSTPSSTTISTSTPTTTTTIVTSSSTIPTATPTQGNVVPSPTIHTQIQFCNNYDDLNINPASVSSYTAFLKTQIQNICGDVNGNRIQNFHLVKDYDGKALIQFDVVQGPGKTPEEIFAGIQDKLNTNTFMVRDINGVQYTVCDTKNVCPWTDYGTCPDQLCQNGGRCNVAATCQYFCQCTGDWTGRYCEQKPTAPQAVKKKQNLWLLWLLIVPLALLLLLLLLCCFCCMNRGCVGAAAAPRQKIEIIEEDIYQDVGGCSEHGTVRSCRSVCSRPSIYAVNPNPMCVNDAGSTYYSALGRPFAVAFSDNTFSAVGYASHDTGIYNHCGKKVLPAASCCGDDEIEVIMNKPRRGSGCGSVYSEAGSGYHSALGNRYAVAYNDRSFNTYSSMPRTCSIRHYN